MSTEMKRETVGWQHVAAAPSHTHTEREREGERERGTRTFTPFCCFASDQRQQLQLHCSNWNGLWERDCECDWGLGPGSGWSFPCWPGNVEHLQTNQICIRISFILFCHYCVWTLSVCVCMCVCRCCCKASRVPARVKVKLYLYLPVAKSEITSKMHAESARPWNDLQSGHICMRVPPYFIKYFHIRC